jgi:hypothetical protein
MPTISPPLPTKLINPKDDLTRLGAGIFAPGGVDNTALYPGGPRPSDLTDDHLNGRETEFFKEGIERLDSASGAEKSSFQWAYARATLQVEYNTKFADDPNKDAPREDLDSTDPVVQVIVDAMNKQRSDLEKAGGKQSALNAADRYLPLQSFDDLKKQSWFAGFASQLDAALQSRVPAPTYIVSKYA